MTKVIPFRSPLEKCANCIHYVARRDHGVYLIDGPPDQYCKHPDRLKGCYLCEDTINKFHLRRSPDEWCPKYENAFPVNRIRSKLKVIESIDYEMVYMEKGSFIMGTSEYLGNKKTHTRNEKRHSVTLTRGFNLGVTVVTQSQWLRVMGSKSWPYNDENLREGDDYPVTWISWEDCQRFIKKLNEIEGTDTFRLPTEAEWEYSCRAGTETEFFLVTMKVNWISMVGI